MTGVIFGDVVVGVAVASVNINSCNSDDIVVISVEVSGVRVPEEVGDDKGSSFTSRMDGRVSSNIQHMYMYENELK